MSEEETLDIAEGTSAKEYLKTHKCYYCKCINGETTAQETKKKEEDDEDDTNL